MPSTLRLLGALCIVGNITLVLMNGSLWLWTLGFGLMGIVLLALATVLDRLVHIEFLLRDSAIAVGSRIRTSLGTFEKLGQVEGEAKCVGCGRTVPKAGLYHSAELDAYYHSECLSRDSRSR